MLLDVRHVSFGYRKEERILHDISFSLDKGVFMGILGPNGTGKSTLLKCLNRIYEADAGDIFLDGTPLRALSLREIARKAAYVPQSVAQPFPQTVMETVLMGRLPYSGMHFVEKDREAAERALMETGLSAYALRDARRLSGGERQRVYIARALSGTPELILMDEPTASLDVRHQLEVLSLVRKLAHRSLCSVIMIIHNLNLASMFCDRLLLMKDGKIRKDGTPYEVLTEELLREVYGVETKISVSGGRTNIRLKDPDK